MNQCLNALLICFVIIKNSTEGLLSSRLIKKTKYTLKIKQNHNKAKVIIQAAEAWSSWRSLQGKEATRRGRVWVEGKRKTSLMVEKQRKEGCLKPFQQEICVKAVHFPNVKKYDY